MKKVAILVCALAAIALWGTALAQETPAAPAGPSAAEVEMQAKLDKAQAALESATRRIDELEAKVNGISSQIGTTSKDVTSLSTQMQALEAKAKEAPAAAAAPAVKITPYGYVKVDMSFDNSATSSTDQPAYVISEKPDFANDRQFSLTVRQTRLGLNVAGPDAGDAKQTGKVEVDFYGMGSSEIKPEPMIRQAYWQMSYPDWNVLVGQTWEPLSPLFTGTINYPAFALEGNIGYRKPMVRYERSDKVFGDKTLQTDFAVLRGQGSSVFSSTSLDDQASDAGIPVFESRVGMSFPTSLKRPVTVGLSGHWSQEEYDRVTLLAGPPASLKTVSGNGQLFTTYSGCLDWAVPLAEKWDFSGEFFKGRNLDGYTGGIGQGVNNGVTQGTTTFASALNKGIDDIGGWAQICYKPTPKWQFMAGYGADDPDNADLSGAVNRACNVAYFVNGWYNINDKAKIGCELTYMKTYYIGAPDGDNVRIQSALQYSF